MADPSNEKGGVSEPNLDTPSTPTQNQDPEKQYESITKTLTKNTAILSPTPSHASSNHDIHPINTNPYAELGDEVYDKLPPHRKAIITAVLSFCGFLSPVSSTTVLAAVPEVAATFATTGTIVNLSNALYLIFMGISPMVWGPLGNVYGRRICCLISSVLFFAFSIGTALAPNLAAFFVFRILTAFQGTAFLILGSACIGDIYRPVERATALGWFLSGTLVGPAFGPFIGGIIVTFVSWRDIFWLQTALGGLATILVYFFLPETIHHARSSELVGLARREKWAKLWQWTNPLRIVRLYRYPNLLVVGLASSSLVWNMYSLLTPIRYVLNPRFHLTSPLQAGLFYIAPGIGYLAGTLVGGRWADRVVKKWIRKRDGERVSEDRLRSSLPAMGVVLPGCMLIYGWCVQEEKGGVPVPVLAMFAQGVAQLFCFPSLNTYCLDVMQGRSSEVVAGNYMVRYFFAALGTATCLPAIEKMGVGWFSTISALFMVVAAVMVYGTTLYGRGWRDGVDRKKVERLRQKEERRRGEVEG
ncbi:MFS general substrate transporter [Aulographum hederae CBS 113979]|uniref:MFS general substrate transporter n=1 Tax=Aulographum hederae CBS 113979 TaxID=1176131 RepID=A0A6G1HAV2_9PEZI|nr:MFS general substrate transporter [Aulographum hederae CBS 113979]